MQLPDDPTVLVLLVATDGARWLPDTLRGLRAQRHRPIKIVAVDNASTDSSGEILVKALGARRVVTLERRVGYGRAVAAALKVAAERGMDADAFLLLHDDASFVAEDAVERMVETLRADGVGIVGCKLVDWDDPDVLQDVGRTTDRYGRQVPRVERGELDQGQYEGLEEVLYATTAAMLVGREIVERVGLFDTRYVVLRDDLDLCWRARLAGYRTVVNTATAARHARAGERELRHAPPRGRARYYAERNMIATLIKNYSVPRLLLALPVTVVISLWNVVLFLVTGRRRPALQVLEALQWNVTHLPSTLRARVRAQHARAVDDASVVGMMHHGATRLRAQFERAVETVVGPPVEPSEEELEAEPRRFRDVVRAHPVGIGLLALAALVLVAGRGLLSSGALAGADLAPFPDGSRELFAEFASGWRGAGSGGAAPASPALLVMGALTFVAFGSGWFAQRLLLVGLPILAGVAMTRLCRELGLSPVARRLAGVVYALAPPVLVAYGRGSLSDLVLLAAAPGLVLSVLRAASILPGGGWRAVATGIAGLALTAAFAPWALVMVAAAGVLLAIVRGPGSAVAALRRTAILAGGAFALLLPWSLELLRPGSPLVAGAPEAPVRMTDLIALRSGPLEPIPLAVSFGAAIASAAGALVVRGERAAIASALGVLAVAGLIAAWAVGRGAPWIAPRASLPLALVAVAFVALAAIGLEIAGSLLRTRSFGGPHVAVAAVGLVVAAQVAPALAWVARGERPGVVEAGALLPRFFVEEADQAGAFRVLWLGGSADAPVATMTGPEGTSIRAFLTRQAGGGAAALRRVVASIAGGGTETAARELGTLGVRYVIVRPEASADLAAAVERQVDLAFSQRFHDATIYQSTVGLPLAASVGGDAWLAAARRPDAEAIVTAGRAPPSGPGFRRLSSASYRGRVGERRSVVFLAEDFSDGWRAEIGGRTVVPEPSFGWATRFPVPEGARGDARIRWDGQRWHRAALLGEALLVAVFALWWSQRAAKERGER